jgi:hypothetical protein
MSVPTLCHNRCTSPIDGRKLDHLDEGWIVSPEEKPILCCCRVHGETANREYLEKLGERWTFVEAEHVS